MQFDVSTSLFLSFVVNYLNEKLATDETFRRETVCCFGRFPPDYYINKYPMLLFAVFYRSLGWSVVPATPRTKQVMVKWKVYQDCLPTYEEIYYWYVHYCHCHAGSAVVLGSISNLFVVDVDGTEAHQVLCNKIEIDPSVLRARSGSHAPDKYHLFYSHPNVMTNAKYTPWHPKLEFRGNKAIVVLSPTLHMSGNRYIWDSAFDLLLNPLLEVPQAIRTTLAAKARSRVSGSGQQVSAAIIPNMTGDQMMYMLAKLPELSRKTKQFLLGVFAFKESWNTRLFNAACDLCGCGIPFEIGEPVLLQGAKPENDADREIALQTIRSAYSESRTPAKSFKN